MTDSQTDVDAVSRQIADQVATRARDALARATKANADLETAQSQAAEANRRATVARAELQAAVREATSASVTAEHLANLGIQARSYQALRPRSSRRKPTASSPRGQTK